MLDHYKSVELKGLVEIRNTIPILVCCLTTYFYSNQDIMKTIKTISSHCSQ